MIYGILSARNDRSVLQRACVVYGKADIVNAGVRVGNGRIVVESFQKQSARRNVIPISLQKIWPLLLLIQITADESLINNRKVPD